MMINALNSGARVFMADLEDALAPTWANVVGGQAALRDAVRRDARAYDSPRARRTGWTTQTATLVVRPRGWHLDERHVLVDGAPVSASLFDFGLYLFHNAARARAPRAPAPTSTCPSSRATSRRALWNDVFVAAQDAARHPARARSARRS